ncbi:MAG: acyl-CoA dehydrogenase [Betaproteobacteria bacterium]|nr:MAG: acyl-CoA dehydrogenase [Betaproteobacteria bacterium]
MQDWNALDDETFRGEVRRFFREHHPQSLRYASRRPRWREVRDWWATLYRHNWIAPAWPREHGGMGLSPAKLLIFIEEQESYGAARTPDQGIINLGPLLIRYGTPEQQRKYLPPTLSGEYIWCQGYSEPDAGSDLASLRTEAVLKGDEYVVNGSKIWTTMAHDATHIFLLARTDKQAKKQEGISFLMMDMRSSGITVRPIRNIAGHEEFCQVFFDSARTHRSNRVGEQNRGWSLAKALLGFERIFIGSPKYCQFTLAQLAALAAERGLMDDPVFSDRLVQLRLDTEDLASVFARFAEVMRNGSETLGPEVSMLKIWASETFQRITEFTLESLGNAGAIAAALPCGDRTIDAVNTFYYARPATFYGGSNEIQRNILAKHVLRLPE